MPVNIRCLTCESVVLGFETSPFRPVGGDVRPDCGSDEFEIAD